jgi:hypothetical protein
MDKFIFLKQQNDLKSDIDFIRSLYQCEHTTPLQTSYGYASGWRGLGKTHHCPICCKVLWFEDDTFMNDELEIKYNEAKRKENAKWEPK